MTNDTDWSNVYENGGDFRVLTPYELTSILQHIPKESTPRNALDIGCGTGQLTRDLWLRGISVKGIDPASKAIEIAKSASTAVSDESLEYTVGNIFDLPKTEQYSFIFCKLVYAFIEDKEVFLDAIKIHMQPRSGAFIMITPISGSNISKTKPFICVDYDLTLEQLDRKFNSVVSYSLGDVECFIAHNLRLES